MSNLAPLALTGALMLSPLAAAWSAVPAALAQPAVQSPKALGAAMLAITRAGDRIVAVGERGTILLSDDDGKSWQQAQVPVRTSLTAVQFVNGKSGWAVGHLGVVLHTDDGGKTWNKQLDGIAAAQLAHDAAQKAFEQAATKTPELEKALADAVRLVKDGPDKPFLDLAFDNEQTGYIVGAYNMMFKTTDGGKTWQPWQSHVVNPKGLHLYGIRAAGGSAYVAGEQGLLLRSTDGGASFVQLASPYKGTWFGIVAAKSGELVAYGLRGNAFRSEDQGRTWEKVETGIQTSIVAGLELADGSLALVSQGGDVLVSGDKGHTFRPRQGGEPLPLAGVVQARDGGLLVAGLRGLKRLAPPPALPQK
jgi:photosystem II stability/assembly factor-like uncharacterized protein